jgi:hypothetical protein
MEEILIPHNYAEPIFMIGFELPNFVFKIHLNTSLHGRMLTKGADIGLLPVKKKEK